MAVLLLGLGACLPLTARPHQDNFHYLDLVSTGASFIQLCIALQGLEWYLACLTTYRALGGFTVSRAFAAIIAYLADHPSANDTLQGVMQWWLFAEGVPWSRAQIEEALVQGVEKGWILETRGGDGQLRYSLMPGKFAEISGLLKRNPEV